jgi:hypothetical protein
MPGLSLNVEWEGLKAKRERQQQSIALAQDLMNKGLEPDAINGVVHDWVKSGNLNIPTQQTKMLPTDLSASDVTERSTQVPVSFKPKRKQLYAFDKAAGSFRRGPQETDNIEPVVQGYDSRPKDAGATDGEEVIMNDDGTEVSRNPNGRKFNTFHYVHPKSAGRGGAGGDPNDRKYKQKVVLTYLQALAKGQATDEMARAAASAQEDLGYEVQEDVPEPTLGERAQSAASDATGGRIPKPAPRPGVKVPVFSPKDTGVKFDNTAYQRDLANARNAVQSGAVKRAEAERRMKSKYGANFKGL